MNAPGREQIRELLFKERRLLLGVSLVLLAHQLLGITINKDAETLGLRFDIENPERVFLGIWLVWGWCLWRFVQLMYSLKARSEYPLDTRTTAWRVVCDRVLLRLVRKEAVALYNKEVRRDMRRGLSVSIYNRGRVTRGGIAEPHWLEVSVTRRWMADPQQPGNAAQLSSLESQALTGEHVRQWEIGGPGGHGTEGGVSYKKQIVQVPTRDVEAKRWPYWIAITWTFLFTSFFTDFYIPVTIGLSPAAIGIYQHFHHPGEHTETGTYHTPIRYEQR